MSSLARPSIVLQRDNDGPRPRRARPRRHRATGGASRQAEQGRQAGYSSARGFFFFIF